MNEAFPIERTCSFIGCEHEGIKLRKIELLDKSGWFCARHFLEAIKLGILKDEPDPDKLESEGLTATPTDRRILCTTAITFEMKSVGDSGIGEDNLVRG